MSTAKRSQPDPGEFSGLVRYAAAVAEASDPDEVRAIANRGRDDEPWPPPSAPLDVARRIAAEYMHDGHSTLLYQQGAWLSWTGPHWAELGADEMRGRLYELLGDAVYLVVVNDELKEVPWNPNRKTIGDVLDALGAGCVLLPGDVHPPAQLDGGNRPGTFIAYANGLLNIDTGKLHRHDPRFYNTVSVPFAYDRRAQCPAWLGFLDELWPDDQESIDTLQEWFGYVMSGRNNQQKALLVQGPWRGGKGTIRGVLEGLLGKSNTIGVTLASLADRFGLQPVIGKSLTFVSDARLDPKMSSYLIVERLLTITGDDPVTIDRKNRLPWEGHLPTRFMVMSNNLPRFTDTSGTVISRFVTLRLTESWLGREDTTLAGRLATELPGISNWGLAGLARLLERGRFVEPKSSRAVVRAMVDDTAPHKAFLRDRCELGADRRVSIVTLFETWKAWCLESNREHPGSVQTFGRDLHAVAPGLRVVRPRDGKSRMRYFEGIGLKK